MTIKINKLSKKYGEKTVFEGFSAELSADGVLIIQGKSGFGKTTLIRMIAGLEKPDSGEIIKPEGNISFMFQEDRLIPFVSVLKNLTAVTDRETAVRYLKMLGLENELDSPPSSLSGGMQRRVSLARALCFDSRLVILDEPFKGLDERLKADICALIKRESKDRDFIIVSHDTKDGELLGGKVIDLSALAY